MLFHVADPSRHKNLLILRRAAGAPFNLGATAAIGPSRRTKEIFAPQDEGGLFYGAPRQKGEKSCAS